MKKYILIIIAIVLITGGVWWWKASNNNIKETQEKNSTSNYQAERSSTNQNIENNTNSISSNNNSNTNNTNTNVENNTNTSNATNSTNNQQQNQTEVPSKEIEIARFSTKVYNKDSKRQNNMAITCKALSTKKIEPGETFSFCNTVGKATSSKGYQEADIYVDGKKEKGLGGGNCQVSTTLYNAVLKVPELEVTERHQHSGKVPYIQAGKDAAVAYGAYDFKFKNNTGSTIKIVMENTSNNITAKIIKL